MNALLAQFLAEARDGLQDIDDRLLALEARPDDADGMAALFRVVHTLKGNAGLFDFPELSRVLHAGEDVLASVRRGELAFDRAMADALLDAMDFVRLLLEDIETTGGIGAERAADSARLAAALRRFDIGNAPAADRATAHAAAEPAAPAWIAAAHHALEPSVCAQLPATAAGDPTWWWVEYVPAPDCFFRGEDPLHLVRGLEGVAWQAVVPAAEWPPLAEFDPYDCRLAFRLLVHATVATLDQLFRYVADEVQRWPAVAPAAASPGATPPGDAALLDELRAIQAHILTLPDDVPHAAGRRRAAALVAERLAAAAARTTPPPDAAVAQTSPVAPSAEPDVRFGRRAEDQATTIRHLKVEPAKIDRLMQLAGELVVARNALPFLAQRAEAGIAGREIARDLKNHHAVVHRLVEELQDAIRQVRMVPMQFVLQRVPRLVRDLSARLGKDVRVVLEGEEAEADKQIVEGLADPLVHLVRNSLDHGFETPDVRVAAGKPAHGTLTLRATQEADRLHLAISDDGRGIDPAVIRRKALAQGIVTAEALERLDDQAVIALIFHSGFSTAEAVSDISGRGVGMDAVRAAIEGMGGSLHVESAVGHGTTITLALPLSVSVTRVLVVEAEGQRFGVPVEHVVETVRVPAADVRGLGDGEAVVRRGRIVPLRSMAALLGGARDGGGSTRLGNDDRAVLVVRSGATPVGLCVDGFIGNEDVLLSPMAGVLAGLTAYAGSALLGDGSVLMVLNLRELLG